MIEIELIKVDGDNVKIAKKDVTLFSRTQLEHIRLQLDAELAKVEGMLAEMDK